MGEAPPHPKRLKPARTRQGCKQSSWRAEFFALPEKRLEFAELRLGLARVDQLGCKL